MMQRCYNPKAKSWPWYGARGIKVCRRWRKFENFLDDMGQRPIGRTLDRIDSDKNYTPRNTRWATRAEQSAGQRQSGNVRRIRAPIL